MAAPRRGTSRRASPRTCPTSPAVAAGDGFAWAPDSRALAFETHPEQTKATSTNGEIYEVALSGGPAKKLSDNPAMDTTPRYSPDGKYLAWRAQRRPGFESDKWELWVMDRATGKVMRTTQAFDQSFGDFQWQGTDLVGVCDRQGHADLFRWDGKTVQRLSTGLHVEGFALAKDHAVVTLHQPHHPPGPLHPGLQDRPGHPRHAAQRGPGHGAGPQPRRGPLDRHRLPVNGKPTKAHAFIVKPVGYDPDEDLPRGLRHPRRTPGRLGRFLAPPLERPGLGRPRLHHRAAQSPRVHGLRPGLHGRHQRRLERRRHDAT